MELKDTRCSKVIATLTIRFFSIQDWTELMSQILASPSTFLHEIGTHPPLAVDTDYRTSLEHRMKSILENANADGDVTFVVGEAGARIKAHSLIIRHSIQVPILHESMGEGLSKEVTITDTQPAPFSAFLRYVYTGKAPYCDLETHAADLLALGDKYDLPDLRGICESFLHSQLLSSSPPPHDAFELLALADRHRAPRLKEACLDLIATLGGEALAGPGFLALPKRLLQEAFRDSIQRKHRKLLQAEEAEAAVAGA
jgi:hypothetical protein